MYFPNNEIPLSPAFLKPNVHLVLDSISSFAPCGVITADGVTHECDVILLATGFDVLSASRPYDIVGKEGVNVQEEWGDTPRAYKGANYPGEAKK